MSDPWILHDPNVSDLPFERLDRCLEQAALAIEAYLDDVNQEWNDEVKQVYISRAGIVTHRATKTVIDRSEEIAKQLEDDPDYVPEFDEWWNFHMAEVEPVLE